MHVTKMETQILQGCHFLADPVHASQVNSSL